MNLILLASEQQCSHNSYDLSERQIQHVTQVLKKRDGDRVRVGVLNGDLGEAVFDASLQRVTILNLDTSPPAALPMELVLALPRPNMLKRTLLNITAMGVKKIHLLNSAKVEKSYWQSPVLEADALHQYLLEGLEQARDTQLPTIEFHKRFRPFVEDVLPSILADKKGLLAHPYQAKSCPVDIEYSCLLGIGPEGGWNEFEVEKWVEAGMDTVHLGERILKVETAVPVVISRLYPAR